LPVTVDSEATRFRATFAYLLCHIPPYTKNLLPLAIFFLPMGISDVSLCPLASCPIKLMRGSKMKVSEEIRNIEKKIEDLEKNLSDQKAILVYLKDKQNARSSSGKGRGHRKRSDNSLNGQIALLLKEVGRPMEVGEMAKALVAKGVTTNSKYGLAPMIASSVRKDEKTFYRIKRGLYCLKSQENESKELVTE
jgi:hypothetical protein